MCTHCLFCGEFNSKQLLHEAFFHKIGIFCSVQPWSEYNLPLLYIIFQPYQSFETRSSTLGEIDMCAHWLFYGELHSKKLLLEPFFYKISIFCSIQPWNENNLTFLPDNDYVVEEWHCVRSWCTFVH